MKRDVTADLPPVANLRAIRELTAEEAASLAEDLMAYQQHFASLFSRREQREWATLYSGVLKSWAISNSAFLGQKEDSHSAGTIHVHPER
ncbi:hypothetical protein KSC_068990 [Ktedonobacter sp. SOSP1-52]|uniref:hypothetical protein n=1 Tax=Ktedonobacter sp. SOSP1-52 TaxID=2778366 RepID=UPI001915EEEA|nr:hypothetical protein [Ktedonobacter sp. SOSP1-52]GHO68007.1 hypothetical protein KSC_068990 [Ktedonobacter sp. SOSP1-52]